MDFKMVWRRTNEIPGSFTQMNAEKLYEYAMECKDTMVEVGVDQGRSASVLLSVAAQTGVKLVLVDSWESILITNKGKVEKLVKEFDAEVKIVHARSVEGGKHVALNSCGLLHIDANHYDENPGNDCKTWLPKLKSGGVVCFHDYGATFPAVTEAVDEHTKGWEDLGNWEGLAIRRKP